MRKCHCVARRLDATVGRMTTFAKELRQAWRSLLHRKAYFLTCAGTLTLVLGANAAMFAVVNATMLRPMPFATSGEVVHLFVQPPGTTSIPDRNPLQQMEVPRLRERARTLARLEGFYPSERVVTRGGEPGVAQSRGRDARTADDDGGADRAGPIVPAKRRGAGTLRGGDHRSLLARHPRRRQRARHVTRHRRSTPHHRRHPGADVFRAVPQRADLHAARGQPRAATAQRRRARCVGLAELAPGATIAQARDELATISRQLAQEFPRTHNGWILGAEPAREWQYGSMRAPLLMLFAATAFVLLIACVNIANLTSAHAIARSGELSLRLALGASRRDVLRIAPGGAADRVRERLAAGPVARVGGGARAAGDRSDDRANARRGLDRLARADLQRRRRDPDRGRRLRRARDSRDARADVDGDRRERRPDHGLADGGAHPARAGLDRSGAVPRAVDGRRRAGPGPARSVAAQPRLRIGRRADRADPAARRRLQDARARAPPWCSGCSTTFARCRASARRAPRRTCSCRAFRIRP